MCTQKKHKVSQSILWNLFLASYNGDTFNQNDKLIFEVIISQPNENYTAMQFEWEIEYEDGATREIIVQNLLNDTIFDFVTQYHNYLVIDVSKDENSFFEANINYTINVHATMDPNKYNCDIYTYTQVLCSESGSTSATITMNEAPMDGNCTIVQENNDVIYAFDTLVNVSCYGWYDQHKPLHYSFVLNDGM